jgi:hypothetical protein
MAHAPGSTKSPETDDQMIYCGRSPCLVEIKKIIGLFINPGINDKRMNEGKAAELLMEAFIGFTLVSAILYVINHQGILDPALVPLIEVAMMVIGFLITVHALKDEISYGMVFGIVLSFLSYSSLFSSFGLLFQLLLVGVFIIGAYLFFPEMVRRISRTVADAFR